MNLKNILSKVSILLLMYVSSVSAQETAKPHAKMAWNQEQFSITYDKNIISIKGNVNKELEATFILKGNARFKAKKQVKDAIWGTGEQLVFESQENHYQTTLTTYPQNPFVYLHTSILNKSNSEIKISRMDVADVKLQIGNEFDGLTTLGTGGFSAIEQTKGSYLYSLLANPKTRHSILAGWLTQNTGVDTLSPNINTSNGKKSYTLRASLEFGNYNVLKGQSRETDVLIVGFFADGRKGLETYGDYLAKAYNIKLPAKPDVYCTWYHRALTGSGASNEVELAKNISFIADSLAPFGLNTVQIDDHWQNNELKGVEGKEAQKKFLGPGPVKTFLNPNANFPSGMEAISNKAIENKLTSGLWFMPFAGDMRNPIFDHEIFAKDMNGKPFEAKKWSGTTIDATNPKGEAFLRARFKRIYNWGYRYYKIDGLHIGAPTENIYVNRTYDGIDNYAKATIYDPNQTFVQGFRKGLKILKEEAPDVFLLGCTMTQNMSSFGSSIGTLDAMRVGPDNDGGRMGKWKGITTGADFAGNLYFLNNKVWYNDPDPYYPNETNPIEKAQWMASWQAVSGTMNTTSAQYATLPASRLDMIKRTLPTHTLNARPIDILESAKPNIWMVENDRVHIMGLFNWEENKETIIKSTLGRLDLDDTKSYEVFDFWKNEYLGTIKTLLSTKLAPASCQVLAIRAAKSYPQVLSTSRHITQGLIDITEESWNKSAQKLYGKSQVVKNDFYELRIVLPEGVNAPKSAKCNARQMKVDTKGRLVRVSYTPDSTGEVQWEIQF